MGILDFIPKFKQSPQVSDSNYLSLSITPDEVIATIWTFNEDEPQVLGFGKKKFENVDSLVHQAAVAIDKAGEQAKSDVEKTVFGISHFWLENSKPKPQTNKLLKDMAEDLELVSQAFIPLSSAVNHLLKIKEGKTPNAVLIGVFGNFLEVHLLAENLVVKSLKSLSTASVEKINQLVTNLKEEGKSLPARVVFYGDDRPDLFEKVKKSFPQDLFGTEPNMSFVDERDLGLAIAYAQAADILGREPQVARGVTTVLPQKEDQLKEPESDELGFMEGEDVLLIKNKEVEESPPKEELAIEEPVPKEVVPENQPEVNKNFEKPQGSNSKFAFLSIFARFPKLLKLPKFNLPLSGKKLGFAIAGLVVLLLIVGFTLSVFVTVAEVTIKVNAKNQEESFKAAVSVGSGDETKVAGTEQKGTASSSGKKVTTGSKKLGNKAKGTIKVLNWDKSPKTFGSGAEIITKDGLKFTIDHEVQVASRSATTPGENKVASTAGDLGPKYNISSGVDMTIVGFDEIFYSAVTDSEFTGGDERQSTVVSQEDLTSLEKSQTETLTEKAKEDLKNKSPGQKINDDAIVVKVLKKEFDKKLDEEATLVNLDMEIEASAIVYSEDDLKSYLAKNLKDVPDNMEALPQNIQIIDVNATRSKNNLNLSGKLTAGLVPKFNEDDLTSKIAGKNTKEARSILKEIPEVSDVLFKFTPNIPFFDTLPKNKEKIRFKIEAS